MLYVICLIKRKNNEIIGYRVFDTYSDSVMEIEPSVLKNIILNTDIQVVSTSVENGNIMLKDWAADIGTETYEYNKDLNIKRYGPKYVLLARKEDSYKMIECRGIISIFSIEELTHAIKLNAVANYNTTGYGKISKPRLLDAYEINNNEKFNKIIASKYKSFVAKTSLLWHKSMTFDYEIENHDVKLKKYTGLSAHVVIPSFITSIMRYAFSSEGIATVVLNEGLQVIGTNAFSFNYISHIEIPSTVELVCVEAFENNSKLTKTDGTTLNTNRFKLRSDKTIVLQRATQ